LVGRNGVTLAEKFAEGASTYLGMLTRGFPNVFIMPTPALQSVVTVNYTQLAVVGADFVGGAVRVLEARGAKVFDVEADAEAAWTQKIIDGFIDPSHVMAACTPSRLNNEGHPEGINPRNGNWGRGFGDFFAYRDLLEQWVADGDCDGLEVS
jgi:hypothetical protein